MKDKIFSDFDILSLDDKKNIILDELYDNIQVSQRLCKKRKMDFLKVDKNDKFVDKSCLSDDEFLNLLFEYLIVLRENNSNLLIDLLK